MERNVERRGCGGGCFNLLVYEKLLIAVGYSV